MNRIRLLPEQVANQIAAGEVVERPASVVKELVENSLDADARQITITIKNGGKSLIRVADDGVGMSRDDALLALERHATSKIAKAEDLAAIHTLGFRGEAIPSIASVSRFAMTTRERGALGGTRIEIAGGKLLSVQEVGTAEGTVVEVRNLFFNLPARRKFLRSAATELAHIQHAATLAALGHTAVALRLLVDGREVFHLAPATELADRLRELYGDKLSGQLLPVRFVRAPVTVRGYVAKPGVSRADRRQQHAFVNGRPVDSRGINYALREAYHTGLMRGQFPITFLFVDIDPALVDVNIHPAKREVRFRDEFAVRQCVIEAVRAALETAAAGPRGVQPIATSVAASVLGTARPSAPPADRPPRVEPGSASRPSAQPAELPLPPASPEAEPEPSPHPQPVTGWAGEGKDRVPAGEEGTWRVLGSIGQLYVLAESDEGLVLIDQHAAHERVLFEQMLRQLAAAAAPSQKLLLPLTLELDARDAAFLLRNLEALQKLGVGISEFGDRTFLVDSLPPYFPLDGLDQTFRQIIDELRQTGEQIHARRLSEDKIATAVCRHAVKAHDPLSREELRGLLEQLHRCEFPYTCPHGRPTMIQIGYAELEKKFRRIV